MTDKQMEEKKKEFEDLISVELQEWYRLGLHDGFKIDDDMLLSHKEMVEGVIKKQPSTEIWDFIEKLVEEVEREQRKLIEQFFDNDKRKNMPDVPIELLVEAEKIDSYDEGWKDGCEAGQRSLN